MANTGDLATESAVYNVEFKSTADDAWYTVRLLLFGDALTVKFFGFAAAWDERFSASDFAAPDAVDEFCQRFRPLSVQAQDGQCAQIAEGKVVCASIASADGADVRLSWVDISKLVYVAAGISMSILKPEDDQTKVDMSLVHHEKHREEDGEEMEGTRGATAAVQTIEGRVSHCCYETNQDEDMAAESFDMNSIKESSSHHFVIIENLEKDLLPSSIMEFIHKQTSVSLQAYVLPSLSSESYTRGVIMLDSRAKLKKIIDFLSNPDHIIMSSTGRPWVISEKIMRPETLEKTPGSLMPEFQDKAIDSKLKVVHSGTKEYRTAKRLIDLFTDFMNHQQRLHKRLALEERNILQPSHTV
ncbi:hypothetical protein RJ640_011889 [Escallonia rubra]|uniref:SAWADEE domain-containing protein n=1 Tax=Escallonia rubra TaxID=112253 RepID=A0AA88RNY5_9ASTE|nr:hypothetical protein RJ640_011889 [Escallonia rubra]